MASSQLINNQEGIKHDNGKPALGFLVKSFPNALILAAKQNDFGAKKYSPLNWMKITPERYEDALLRHYFSVLVDPKSIDEESGVPHFGALIWNSLALTELRVHESGTQLYNIIK